MTLHHVRRGVGEPLVLIHGLGSHWRIWQAVLDPLAASYDVIALDLPGFGQSPALDREPTPAALAGAVADFFERLGVERPHVAGNSLGGWVALELAKAGVVRSVTAISPAGLWRDRNPLTSQTGVTAARLLAQVARPVVPLLGRSRLAREATMWLTFARPAQVPAAAAVADVRAFADAPSFWPAFRATRTRRFEGGQGIDVPVTIAFGDKDRLLVPTQNAARDQLPAHQREVCLPGCGHSPMWDDPLAVVRVIEETTRSVLG